MNAHTGAGYVVPADMNIPTAGAIAWWRLKGTVSHSDLLAAWSSAGLDTSLLPLPPTPEQGLRRALKEQEERRVMARPLGKKGSFALVEESLTGKDLEYRTLFKISVDLVGNLHFEDATSAHASHEQQIREAYAKHVSALSQGDISGWLVELAYHVKAVSLRDTGGIYFVPSTQLQLWRTVVGVLREVSEAQMFEVPALKSSEAVDAILDAIATEAKDEIAKLEAALENDMGKRGLHNRSERAGAMLEKLKAYEALLGKGVETIGQRLVDLQIELSTAALAAGGDE